MTIRVLIVDDSRFICKRIAEILEEDSIFKVVGSALNGKQALLMAAQLEPDVITMDIEMPVMDGISAVKAIMAECPTAILMFSAATHTGAKATLDALSAGAIDFLPKKLDEIDGNREVAKRMIRRRVRTVALQANRIKQKTVSAIAKTTTTTFTTTDSRPQIPKNRNPSLVRTVIRDIELLVVVASTGGPVAIQKVMTQLPANCLFPILIVQHMPHNFTKSFAERLNQLCQVKVKEAVDGDLLKPGEALLAPGGMQMEVTLKSAKKTVRIMVKQENEIYSPCADLTLSSVAQVYSANVLTVVLTGMGADGKKGAEKLKQKGFPVWAQDEASCTIYGMPKAIVDANLADKVYSLNEIANEFNKLR